LALSDVRSARRADGDPVIDHAVAVVVEAVADLHRRSHRAFAGERSAQAPRCAGRALAHVAPAGVAALGVALVDGAVAIVVEAVASLGRGPRLADAGERPVDARERTEPALSSRRRAARRPAARIALVDDRVAVVVERVAHLGSGSDAARAGQRAADAPGGAESTLALVGPAARPSAGVPLVDARIAVVVTRVAHLGGGSAGTDAREGPADAAPLPEHAFADVAAARAGARDGLVDRAVAIVVDGVA